MWNIVWLNWQKFTQNFSWSFLQSTQLVWARKAWSKKYRWVAHRSLTFWAKKCFSVLGFVLEGINNENFMVSCFSSIYRTVWTSVTMVTKQNHFFTRHSPSSCSAVLIVVSHMVKASLFKSKWLRSLIISSTGYDSQWNISMKIQ